MSGTLFVVATPIGNLEDITQRALRVLREVDVIACEDTRHTRTLLTHYAIGTPMVSYHEHNEKERSQELVSRLLGGEDVALVSDAGTPMISDPGYVVVRQAGESGIRVVPIPGPSALISALSVSGMEADRFVFAGFLPHKDGARKDRLAELAREKQTLVFYETPHRIIEALTDAIELLGDRRAVLGRELTKLHEEVLRGSLSEILGRLGQAPRRGEFVLVVEGATDSVVQVDSDVGTRVAELERAGLDRMDAIKQVARERGISKREVYKLLI